MQLIVILPAVVAIDVRKKYADGRSVFWNFKDIPDPVVTPPSYHVIECR